MARPCKLTPEIQQRIGDNVALGLTYSLAAESTCITYKTFNSWMKRGKRRNLGNIISFIDISKNEMLKVLKNVLNVLVMQLMQEIAKFVCGS